MDNPWLQITKDDFIPDVDKDKVKDFDDRRRVEHTKIHMELPPEPYAGRKDAPVVLLALRPSYHPLDHIYMCDNADFAASMQRTRAFEKQDYPFYHLNEKYPENPGLKFWEKRLKAPIKKLGYRACSQGFLLLQLFPYKTKAKINGKKLSSSFSFTCTLLQKAIERNAIIIPMYGRKKWEENISKLSSYERYFTFDEKHNLKRIISSKHFPNGKYEQIIAAISENTPPE